MLSPTEIIKERLSIADVVGSYVTLEKSGANLKAKCPFHNEKTPSFFVSMARGSYYCFGCGAKGDIFSFVQAFEGLDFIGALRMLAARAGVEVTPEDPRTKSERDRLFSLIETAALFFQKQLDENKEALEYLEKRGLIKETISSWRLGFAPDLWRACSESCREKGFTFAELEKAGLTKTEQGKTYDRFRGRLMFPLFDSSGRVIAFSGRLLGKESEHAPKYLNSPETPIFSKSRILYGFDRAKTEIRRMDYAMLVEGQIDLLMCHQTGFTNTVASSGTAFTEDQLALIKRLSKRMLLVFDADKAGLEASLRSATLALSRGMDVKVAALPEASDPAELIAKDINRFRQCLRLSSHIIDFYLQSILREKLDERSLARSIRDRLLPYVSALESSVEKDHFLKKIAESAGLREESLREDLRFVERKEKAPSNNVADAPLHPRKHLVERLISGLWLWQKQQKAPFIDLIFFKKEVERIAGEEACRFLFSEAEKIGDELIYQAESYYTGSESLPRSARDLLLAFEEDVLRSQLAGAMKELAEAERARQKDETKRLLLLCDTISKRLNSVRQES